MVFQNSFECLEPRTHGLGTKELEKDIYGHFGRRTIDAVERLSVEKK